MLLKAYFATTVALLLFPANATPIKSKPENFETEIARQASLESGLRKWDQGSTGIARVEVGSTGKRYTKSLTGMADAMHPDALDRRVKEFHLQATQQQLEEGKNHVSGMSSGMFNPDTRTLALSTTFKKMGKSRTTDQGLPLPEPYNKAAKAETKAQGVECKHRTNGKCSEGGTMSNWPDHGNKNSLVSSYGTAVERPGAKADNNRKIVQPDLPPPGSTFNKEVTGWHPGCSSAKKGEFGCLTTAHRNGVVDVHDPAKGAANDVSQGIVAARRKQIGPQIAALIKDKQKATRDGHNAAHSAEGSVAKGTVASATAKFEERIDKKSDRETHSFPPGKKPRLKSRGVLSPMRSFRYWKRAQIRDSDLKIRDTPWNLYERSVNSDIDDFWL